MESNETEASRLRLGVGPSSPPLSRCVVSHERFRLLRKVGFFGATPLERDCTGRWLIPALPHNCYNHPHPIVRASDERASPRARGGPSAKGSDGLRVLVQLRPAAGPGGATCPFPGVPARRRGAEQFANLCGRSKTLIVRRCAKDSHPSRPGHRRPTPLS